MFSVPLRWPHHPPFLLVMCSLERREELLAMSSAMETGEYMAMLSNQQERELPKISIGVQKMETLPVVSQPAVPAFPKDKLVIHLPSSDEDSFECSSNETIPLPVADSRPAEPFEWSTEETIPVPVSDNLWFADHYMEETSVVVGDVKVDNITAVPAVPCYPTDCFFSDDSSKESI